MPKNSLSKEEALVVFLVIVFFAGGFFTAWLTIQKIHFLQDMFWVSFWACILLFLATIVCFISFLIKEDSNYGYDYNEFLDKRTIGWTSLIGLVLVILAFLSMIHFYDAGFSETAIKDLIQAEGKMEEFNYISGALTGTIFIDLTIESLDSARDIICKDSNIGCEQFTKSYESIKVIIEAKETADDIMGIVGLANRLEVSQKTQ